MAKPEFWSWVHPETCVNVEGVRRRSKKQKKESQSQEKFVILVSWPFRMSLKITQELCPGHGQCACHDFKHKTGFI